jgi:hypothetical protein
MSVDTTEVIKLVERVKRGSRQPEVLRLCDIVLGLVGKTRVEPVRAEVAKRGSAAGCPVCAARREAKALSMQRWRGKGGKR